MVIGTKIPSFKSITKNKEILVYNKPEIVYIPLVCGNDTNVSLCVNKGDYVYKGDTLGNRNGNLFMPIISSVSGYILDVKEMTYANGSNVKCVEIKNDFKEVIKHNTKEVNDISKYSKEEFINLLKEKGIRGLGGADFPTFVKYDTDKKIKNLIVNAVECEPYITCDYVILKNNPQEILEVIDAIMTINKIDNGFIAIKKNNKKIIDIYNNYIGTYPNIKIVEVNNLYPMGWEKNLINVVLNKTYVKLPSEVNTVVNNLSTVYAIYNLLKKHRPITERVITISGDCVKNPKNVLVKIGTPVKEILKELGIDDRKVIFIANGPMMGTNVDIDDLIVSCNLNCVLALNKCEFGEEENCLRCGRCTNVCPAKLSPVLIKDSINNISKLKELEVNRCVECGLCSYICPSKILVREYIRQAKDNLRKDNANGKN